MTLLSIDGDRLSVLIDRASADVTSAMVHLQRGRVDRFAEMVERAGRQLDEAVRVARRRRVARDVPRDRVGTGARNAKG